MWKISDTTSEARDQKSRGKTMFTARNTERNPSVETLDVRKPGKNKKTSTTLTGFRERLRAPFLEEV